MTATICCTAWNVASFTLNCSRSQTYATVISSTASAPPTRSQQSSVASTRRSFWSRGQAVRGAPAIVDASSTTFLNRTTLWRSFASVRTGTTVTPFVSRGTRTSDVPVPSRAATRNASADTPWSTHVFSPFSTSRRPRRASVVLNARGSRAASRSSSASVTSFSPRAIAGSHSRFCGMLPSMLSATLPAKLAKRPNGATARPHSSISRPSSRIDAPCPPYCSGMP
jgi:hypothetical protein